MQKYENGLCMSTKISMRLGKRGLEIIDMSIIH